MIKISNKLEEINKIETMNQKKVVDKKAILKLLSEEGLGQNEAKVYYALLGLGSGNLSTIAERSKIHPQSVKNALRDLKKVGLVSKTNHKLTRALYSPAPPYTISQRIHSRHERFVEVLPSLQKMYRQNTSRLISVYEGLPAFQRHLQIFIENLKRGECIRVLNHPGERILDILPNSYDRIESARLKNSNSKMALVDQGDLNSFRQRPDITEELNSEYRSSPRSTGPMISFISNGSVISYFADQAEPTTFIIESKEYAKQSILIFDYLWASSKAVI